MKKIRLRDVADVITKGTTPTSIGYEFVNKGINFIKVESITEDGAFIENKFAYITDECNKKLSRSQLQENDILFSIAGAIGRVAIVDKNILPANTNQALAIIRLHKGVYEYNFLKYILKSPAISKQFEKQKQGVAQINLSLKNIGDFEIPVISIEQQKKIADEFDKVTVLIDKRKKQLEKLDELVKSRFIELFESSELSGETTIETITEQVKVGFVGTCEKYYTDESGVPMLRTGNITEKGIDLKDLKHVTREFHEKNRKSQIHPGDLLIARHGSNGQANVYFGPEAQCLNAVVVVPNQSVASSVFLAGLINSPMVKEQIERTLVGSTQRVVNTKSIASLKVRIPGATVQSQYEEFVKQTDKSKLEVQKSLEKLELLKKALMQKYFG